MDARVHDAFAERADDDGETRDLKFLLDEGLSLLAGYSRITDVGVRRALAGLVDALADAEGRTATASA